jgi:hypothetical protein
MAAVCRRIGTDQAFVAKKIPELNRVIVENRRDFLRIKTVIRGNFQKLLVQKTFNELIDQRISPGNAQMQKALPKGFDLRDASVRHHYQRLRQEFADEVNELRSERAKMDLRPNKMAGAAKLSAQSPPNPEKNRKWGGRRDSNPQQQAPQAWTLPLSYDHQPGA